MPRNGNASRVIIVKIGGSLAHGRQCAAWLDVLAAWGGPLILVPGGGPFADCVRTTQATMRFGDATAHRMALMAMEQYAVALAAQAPVFALAASRDELDGALRAGQIPIWLPTKMILAAPEVPETWELTSDSLAAWLAGILGARRLLLIKSVDQTVPVTASDLAANKIVDPLFPRFAAQSRAEVWLAGPASLARALRILQSDGMPGTKITIP
jgi:5-(aminomethyl)-3-furanmethanol phosphate kinase